MAMRTAVTPTSSVAVPEKLTGELTVDPADGAVARESGSRFTSDVVVAGIELDVDVDVELVVELVVVVVVTGTLVVVVAGPVVVVVAPVVLVGPIVVVEGADPGFPPGTRCHDV